MMVLNYDDIENSLLPFWEEFLAYMDKKDVRTIGPHNSGVEKQQPFVTYKDSATPLVDLIEGYLTDDHSVALDARRAIFFDTLKNAEVLGVFYSLENDPLLFNHEQSESFQTYVQSKKILQECIVELKQENRRGGELNMNGFFIQLNMEKLQKNISNYENSSKQYALVDPLNYLTRVAQTVLQLSHERCLKHHLGELPDYQLPHYTQTVMVEPSLEVRVISDPHKNNLMDNIDRAIDQANQYNMNIIRKFGRKR